MKIKKIIDILIYTLVILIIFDFGVLRGIFKFGIPYKDFLGVGNLRYYVPYAEFTLDRIVGSNGVHSFAEGKYFSQDENTLKVAFFGGSTGVPLNKEYFANKLKEYLKTDKEIEFYNFSCYSSNHRQHLHMILEVLPKYKPDIVIFYGGVNEITQPLWYDPRPGYPYNYYYKNDTSIFRRFLIENSAVVSSLENKYRNISSYQKIYKQCNVGSEKWYKDVVNNYIETLELANKVTSILNSPAYGHTKFIAFYQPYVLFNDNFVKLNDMARKALKNKNYVIDLFNEFDSYDSNIWLDYCHVSDESGANEHIMDVMSKEVAKKFPLKTANISTKARLKFFKKEKLI